MIALKLKMPLAGLMEYAAGDTVEVPEVDAVRMVLRGVATCTGADDRAIQAARQKLLQGISAEDQALIIAGRVVVTKKLGLPVAGDPSGARIWADKDGRPLYRYQTSKDRQPKRPVRDTINKLQRKAFGPPKETPAAK